jgi:hypothetical protein
MHLACGLSVGLTGLAAGYAIGIVGDVVCVPRKSIDPSLQANRFSGRSFVYVTITDLCWNGLDFDFRRGFGTLWVLSPLLYRVDQPTDLAIALSSR